MPRWAWIAVLVAMAVPLLGVLMAVAVSGFVMLVIVAAIVFVLNFVRRLFQRRQRNDGRENVRIVVHSARVIDP
jgi:hypothetical protein